MTISVGFALSHERDSPEALVRRADAALYKAKRGGRNRKVKSSTAPPSG